MTQRTADSKLLRTARLLGIQPSVNLT